jgi:hypothetical protein
MSIIGEVITTSGLSEKFLGVENTSIVVAKVKETYRIWNQVEILLMGEVITTSGCSENILWVQNTPIGMAKVKEMYRIWNQVRTHAATLQNNDASTQWLVNKD